MEQSTLDMFFEKIDKKRLTKLLEGGISIKSGTIWYHLIPSGSAAFEIVRNVVESQRLSTFIRYATAGTLATGFLADSVASEDSSKGIWR